MAKQVLICVQQRYAPNPVSCANNGSLALAEILGRKLAELDPPVQLVTMGCMSMCLKGPNVKLMPDGLVWNEVGEAQIATIVESVRSA